MSEQNQVVPLLLYIPGATEIYAEYSTLESGSNWLRVRESLVATSGSNEEAVRRLAKRLGIELINLVPAYKEAARTANALLSARFTLERRRPRDCRRGDRAEALHAAVHG